jgi:hypothetical protein
MGWRSEPVHPALANLVTTPLERRLSEESDQLADWRTRAQSSIMKKHS